VQAGSCPIAGTSPPSCGQAWTSVFLISIGVYTVGLLVYVLCIRRSYKGLLFWWFPPFSALEIVA
jgi:hypothetical protein